MRNTYSNNGLHKRAVGLFYSRDEAEAAIRDLKDSGFDMNRVSVIAKDTNPVAGTETTQNVGNKADDGAKAGAVTGGALGGITGLLVGLGLLAIPGIGPILLAGAEATAIATTVAGGAIGAAAGGLVGALVGLGIPEEKAKIYRDRVASGSFLVMVNAPATEIGRAEAIMRRHGVEELEVYDASESMTTTDTTDVAHPISGIEPRVGGPALSNTAHPISGIEPRVGTTGYTTDSVTGVEPIAGTTGYTTDSVTGVEPMVGTTGYTTDSVTNVEPMVSDRDINRTSMTTPTDDVENIKLYEERLVVDKDRDKTGEVIVGKRVESEMANISVPIEKERVVIERKQGGMQPVDPNTIRFGEGEVARIDVYEETAEIEKQAFVREEVTIRKEVEQDTVEARETIRREELDIDVDGQPNIQKDL